MTMQAMEASAAERRRRENEEIAERLRKEEEEKAERLRREEEEEAERLRREEEEKMANTCYYKEYTPLHHHIPPSIPTRARYDGVHIGDKDMFRQRIVALWLSDVTGKVRCHACSRRAASACIRRCRSPPRWLCINTCLRSRRPSRQTPPGRCTCMCRTVLCCLKLRMPSW